MTKFALLGGVGAFVEQSLRNLNKTSRQVSNHQNDGAEMLVAIKTLVENSTRSCVSFSVLRQFYCHQAISDDSTEKAPKVTISLLWFAHLGFNWARQAMEF